MLKQNKKINTGELAVKKLIETIPLYKYTLCVLVF